MSEAAEVWNVALWSWLVLAVVIVWQWADRRRLKSDVARLGRALLDRPSIAPADGDEREPEARTEVVVREVVKEVPVVREVVKEVPVVREVARPEPEIPAAALRDVGDPQALPDVPDGLPDSAVDGARFGRLVVRGGSVRGEASRRGGVVRKQTTSMAVLTELATPVLLTCVASGRPEAYGFGQLGAAQVCRSLRDKLAERADALELAWGRAEQGNDADLAEILRGVMLALNGPLTLLARERGRDRAELATEVIFLLSRLGDAPKRGHLVAGVGAGSLLRLSPAGEWSTAFTAADGGRADDGGAAMLPDRPEAVAHLLVWTEPGEALFLASRTSAEYLRRDVARDAVTESWAAGPPPLLQFLWQLGLPDQVERKDRSLVGLWETLGDRRVNGAHTTAPRT
jgi:hypothetical protein